MLIADRFVALNGRTIDLASGQAILLRRLPPNDARADVEWDDRCAAISRGPVERAAPALIDYGRLNDGERFEAYRMAPGVGSGQRVLANSAPSGRVDGAEAAIGSADPFGHLLRQASDLFETACFGEPRRLRLLLPGGPARERLLDVIARHARLSGFVPIAVELLAAAERRTSLLMPHLRDIVASRHLLLVARAPIVCTGHGWCADRREATPCPAGIGRLVVESGAQSARPNVLLLVTDAGADGVHPARPCLRCGARREVRWDVAAEAHERYRLATGSDLVRARARAAGALADARSGRALRAERGLRDALGALARREDLAGAASVALNLGCLLLDRGRALDAARTFEIARGYFDRTRDLHGAGRAAVYLGLAWTDEGRLTEAEAACRSARVAAEEAGLGELATEATLGLARCLYWQRRSDEATVLACSLVDTLETTPATTAISPSASTYPLEEGSRHLAVVREGQIAESGWGGDPRAFALARREIAVAESDRRVRALALAARLALVSGDLRGASAHGVRALDRATRGGSAIDRCIAHTALASVRGALNDVAGLLDHVQAGLAAARQAHAPLGALRLRLAACDNLRIAGRQAEAARLLRHLAALDPARFPGLLRARLQIVIAACGRGSAAVGGTSADHPLAGVACPWRRPASRADMAEEIAAVLQVCHDIEDEESALARVCDAVRERLRAVAVGVVGRDAGVPAVLARAGPGAAQSTIVERVLETGLGVAVAPTALGLEAGAAIRYAGSAIGAIVCRWPADALVDPGRPGCLLSAAAAATAPHVRTVLDRRQSAAVTPSTDEAQLVGVSEAIQVLRKAALRAAGAPFPVLVEGESGSGKELIARAIHRDSARRARRFCAINCAALTDDLLEAELFGHARGAFTGAISERIGLFEEADGGTIFLDEVADLSPRAQAKLLRVLQDGEVRRIGENFARHVDTRVVAATNRCLEAEVANGAFRRDLFYRLNVVHIDVPPLRDRPEDIPVLAAHFWQRSAARVGSRATLAPATLVTLARYDWPGNVRELQNVMAALAVAAPRWGSVGPARLPAAVARAETGGATLDQARTVFERRFVQSALARAGGHRGRAAASLGISRQGLAKLIVRLGLQGGDSTD